MERFHLYHFFLLRLRRQLVVFAGFAVVPGLLSMGLAFFLAVRHHPLFEYITQIFIGIFAISIGVTYFFFLRKPKTMADKELDARLRALIQQEATLATQQSMTLTAADRNQLQRYTRNLLVPAMVVGTVLVLGFVWFASQAMLEPATHLLVFGLSCAGWFTLVFLYYKQTAKVFQGNQKVVITGVVTGKIGGKYSKVVVGNYSIPTLRLMFNFFRIGDVVEIHVLEDFGRHILFLLKTDKALDDFLKNPHIPPQDTNQWPPESWWVG